MVSVNNMAFSSFYSITRPRYLILLQRLANVPISEIKEHYEVFI